MMHWSGKTYLAACLASALIPLPTALAAGEPEMSLRLEEYLARVLTNNESIQIKILETEISRRQQLGQQAIFEPVLVNSLSFEDRKNALTEEQKRNLFYAPLFNERNRRYESAVELLTPTGAKLRLGYNGNHLRNNLNRSTYPDGEYSSSAGITLTQPLLKDMGSAATMASIRAAAITSEITYQEYRKNLIELVSKAEAAYWDVYLAQQQLAFSTDSVTVAKTVLQDNQTRLTIGKSSELDVLQAEAGVAQRQAVASEARQKLYEAVNLAMALCSSSAFRPEGRLKAVDTPQAVPPAGDLSAYRQLAEDLNPDLVTLRKQSMMDSVRLAFSKNQRLPQLDLKGSYASSDVYNDFRSPYYNVGNHDFPAWMIGLELRLPLGGNLKARRDLEAARLKCKATELAMKSLGVQLDNGIDAAHKSAMVYFDNLKNLEKVVEFNQNLLKTQLARLEVGKVDSKTVLEAERDLFEARVALAQSQVRFKRATLDLNQTVGSTLKSRNLEISASDLSWRTRVLLRERQITPRAYDDFVEGLAREIETRRQKTSSPTP